MELKKLQSELQRLLTIADRWQRADDITPIERDLMLGRLREIYEALLFGLEDAPQEPIEQPAIGVAVGVTEPAEQAEQAEQPQQEPTEEEPAPAEQQTEPTEEIAPMEAAQREAEPWFLDADDLLSFDALDATEEASFGEEQPSEEQLEEPIAEEEAEEEAEEAFAPEEEQPSQPIELPIDPLPAVEESIEQKEPIEEELAEAEEQPEELPTAQEEPAEPIEQDQEEFVEQEPIEERQPEPVEEEPAQPEQPATPAEPEQEEPAEPATPAEPKPIAQPEPVAEQPQQRVTTLFGEEDASVRHRNRQRAILSLYDTHPKELLPKESEVVAVDVKPEVIEISDQELAASKRIVRRTATQPTKREEVSAPTPAPVQPQEPVSVSTAETSSRPVLGEVIKPVETISDTIAPKPDMATQIHRQSAVVDLRRAVGVNDKYLLIRDLFGGNGSLYEITIRRLNEFQTFDECLIYIAKNFSWNPDSDGARLLMDVLERKFAE